MIEVVKAPPFATIQDLGWETGRRFGLPRSGAMDPLLLRRANHALGNGAGSAAVEWALGPGTLRFHCSAVICVTQGAEARLDGRVQLRPVFPVGDGAMLEIFPGRRERFTYIGVRGGVDVPLLMGSRSTYLPGGFGGLEGRRIKAGDRLPIGPEPADPGSGALEPTVSADPSVDIELRVMQGPQWDRFDVASRSRFFGARFTVAPASDRMGYRLSGAAIHPVEAATLPSEPACLGAVQIPDGGAPIVLMPDGPTVGGYPKLVVLLEEDLARLAQCQPGRGLRFTAV